jgi:MFS family permease
MAVLNPSRAAVARDLGFDPASPVPSFALLAGAAVGALAAGAAADAAGPARALSAVGALFFAGSAACAAASSLPALAAGRALAGLAVGGASALPPRYLADVGAAGAPAWRGALGAAHQVAVCAGIVAAMLAGLPYDGGADGGTAWRRALAAGAVPGAVLALAALVAPESPAWLAVAGRADKAAAAKTALGGRVTVDAGGDGDGLGAARTPLPPALPPPLARQLSDTLALTPRAAAHARDTASLLPSLAPLVSPRGGSPAPTGAPSPLARRYRPHLALALGLALAQQASGINTVILYSSDVLARAGLARPVAGGAAVAAVNACASAAAAACVDAAGRRTLLVGSYAAMSVCLGCLAAAARATAAWAPRAALAALFAYVAAFAAGAGPVTWLYSAEIAPPEVAGGLLGGAAALNWCAAAAVGATFPRAVARLGLPAAYGGYAILNAGAAIWVAGAVVESAGRPLGEVRAAVARARGGRA